MCVGGVIISTQTALVSRSSAHYMLSVNGTCKRPVILACIMHFKALECDVHPSVTSAQ